METVIAKRRDLPANIAALPVEQRLAWLNSSDAVAMLSGAARRRIRRELRGSIERESKLLAHQADAAKVALLAWCCSGYWADLCQAYLEAKGLLSTSRADNERHCRRVGLYPQPGHRICPECGRPTPPNNFGSLGKWREACDDCVALEMDIMRDRLDLPEELGTPDGIRHAF